MFGLLEVDLACDGISTLHDHVEVGVIHETVKAGAVTGWDFVSRGRIVHVLDAEFAEDKTPIRLSLFVKVRDDTFIYTRGFIELAGCTQTVSPLKELQFFLIVHFWDGLLGTTVFAFTDGRIVNNVKISAAHFAFNDRHGAYLVLLKFIRKIYRCFLRGICVY